MRPAQRLWAATRSPSHNGYVLNLSPRFRVWLTEVQPWGGDMDAAQLQTALEAHQAADQVIDVTQTIGICVCAIGIIIACIALIYVANLLRIAAKILTKDIRGIVKELAEARARLDDIEIQLNGSRSGGRGGARPREGA